MNKKNRLYRNTLAAARPLSHPINPSPLSVAIHQTLRATTRRQIAPLVALSLAGLAGPALAQDAVVELSSLDGSNGFVLNGVTERDFSGRSVSAAGDVNGDGVDDLLIGADGADSNGSSSGASYVVFGASGVGSSGTLELSALDGSDGFVINGVNADDFSGVSVSAAGDVNGDGVDDLLI
ncbi:MAG: integrin alpha, partial [Methylococcales bacterium]